MPVRRYELHSRATHPHSPPSTAEKRLLGLEINIPPLSRVVNGVTDGLGLTNSNSNPQQPQQPAPQPSPSPQPTQPTQQPPATQQPPSNPQQPTTNQPAPSQPANQTPPSNPPPPAQQQPSQPSSAGQSNPSGSPSRPPSASGSGVGSSPQPGQSGAPGSGSDSDSDSDSTNGGGGSAGPGNSFVVVPGTDNGTPVANVGGVPSQDGRSTIVSRGPQGTRTLVINGSSTTVVGDLPTGDPFDAPTAGPDASGASKSNSKVAIIAVVSIIAALFLLLLLFFLRRRYRARKTEQRNQWWTARKRTSKDYQDTAAVANNRKSARSSFGTTFEHSNDGHAFDVNFTQGLPALPPMAELRRTHNEFNSPLPTPSQDSHRPLSDSTIGSRSSRDNMSGFAFPVAHTQGSRLSGGSLSAGLNLSEDPFGDPRPRSRASGTVEGTTEEGFFTCSSHTGDLLSEISCVSSSVHGTFNEQEAICRPYTATMPDELTVTPGIRVKVVKVYDDGWAMVEKTDGSASRGLIPLDCLRQPGQDFSDFLQEKRVSNYVASANFRQV